MARDPVRKAHRLARKKWPDVHIGLEEFKAYVEIKRKEIVCSKSGPVRYEKMALEDIYVALAVSERNPIMLAFYYREYGNYIRHVSLHVVKATDMAEDILQQFMLELPKKIRKYRGAGSLYGWTGGVISNFSKDYLRKIRHYEPLETVRDMPSSAPYEQPDIEDQFDIEECRKLFSDILPKAIAVLKKNWQLTVLFRLDGLSNREIAALLKTGEYNISKWLKKAFAKMRKRLLNLASETGPDGEDNLLECLKLVERL